MAQFRCHLYKDPIKRNDTIARSGIVNVAAYNTRTEMTEERRSIILDHSKNPNQCLSYGIHIPRRDAPEWLKEIQASNDVEKLANAIDAREMESAAGKKNTRWQDAQLARAIELNLPHELSREVQEQMIKRFVERNYTDKGHIAIWAIHDSPVNGDDRNIHAHVLVSMRRVDKTGWLDKKDQYRPTEWKQFAETERKSWADIGAEFLEKAGLGLRTSETELGQGEAARWQFGYLDNGGEREKALERGDLEYAELKDRESGKHKGKTATAIERDGRQSTRAQEAAEIETAQENITSLKQEIKSLEREIDMLEITEGLSPNKGRDYAELENTAFDVADRAAFWAKKLEKDGLWEAHRDRVASDIGLAWREANYDPIQFVVNLSESGLVLAENDKGRFVAVDHFGIGHYLTDKTLAAKATAAHELLAETFGSDKLRLPTVQEIRDEMKAEKRAAYKTQQAEIRRADYIDRQRERLADNPTAHAIKTAWERSEDVGSFTAALDEKGIILARVTKEEAEIRKAERDQAFKDKAKYKPRALQEGDLLAVNRNGSVYPLDATTINADDKTIAARLGGLDPTGQPSMAEAKQMQAEKRGQDKEAWIEQRRLDRQIDRIQAAQERPQTNRAVQDIGRAWADSGDGLEFAKELADRNFLLCRVDAADAAKSKNDHALLGTPLYKEGEFVAINKKGYIYRVNAETISMTADNTYDHLKNVTERLEGIPKDVLPNLHEGRLTVEYLKEEKEFSNRDFTRKGDDRVESIAAPFGEALRAVEKVAGFLENFFVPQHTPDGDREEARRRLDAFYARERERGGIER